MILKWDSKIHHLFLTLTVRKHLILTFSYPIIMSTPSHRPGLRHPSILNPQNIAMLNLNEFHGVETENTLTKFNGQVESCVFKDEERLQVAQIRVDTSLGILINSHIRQRTI